MVLLNCHSLFFMYINCYTFNFIRIPGIPYTRSICRIDSDCVWRPGGLHYVVGPVFEKVAINLTIIRRENAPGSIPQPL